MTAQLVQPAAVLHLEYGIASEVAHEPPLGQLQLEVSGNAPLEGDPEHIKRHIVRFDIQLQRDPADYGFLFCRGQLGLLVADEEPGDSIVSLCFLTMVSLVENSIRETGSVVSTGWPTEASEHLDQAGEDGAGENDSGNVEPHLTD